MAILTLNCLGERAIAKPATVLSKTEISQKLQQFPGWTQKNNKIVKTFEFKDFVAAVDFVNRLVEPAELAGHHPDIAINYNKVTVSLTTHDAGGITNQDFALAETISQLTK
ncbi:4a-hydroxytetrahydrobiopterin dehydratase [Myxosarcina sp. GI1]|uniref:4a-hydroxytetrahydrobiopterin dehydratase n=1 Tax=Myxosarcina sp. GI1 TaxID=1541065 RepID=UPI00056C9024